jgi:hypothetical protein
MKFRYFDFGANTAAFLSHLHSPEIEAILRERGLRRPLANHDSEGQSLVHLYEDRTYLVTDAEYQRDFQAAKEAVADADDDYQGTLQKERIMREFNEKYDAKYSDAVYLHRNVPLHHCHQFAPALYRVAQLMFPTRNWTLLKGDVHSTVYCAEDLDDVIVFDLLMYFLHHMLGEPCVTAERVMQNALCCPADGEFVPTIANRRAQTVSSLKKKEV